MSQLIDLTGQEFGSLKVVGLDRIEKWPKANRGAYWKCECACGETKAIKASSLKNGMTRTCGCRSGRKYEYRRSTIPLTKVCVACEVEKDISDFHYSRSRDSYHDKCRGCQKPVASDNRKRDILYQRKREARRVALAHYGNKCVCCGETESIFLAFDHIHGSGNQHRGDLKRRKFSTIAEWLVANHFPDGFQILCFNCNWAKHSNKICPHQLMSSFGICMGG